MDHIEMVDKLREKANVSYEEARQALEKTDWDLLDALVYLEGQGKVRGEGKDTYTTRQEPEPRREAEQDLRGAFTRFFSYVAELINKGNKVLMDATRRGKVVLTIPLTVLILLFLFMFWWVTPAMILGLFFGFRYSIRGSGVAETVNKVMDKAAQTAENIKQGVNVNVHREDKAEEK
jgi:hypothetical protein